MVAGAGYEPMTFRLLVAIASSEYALEDNSFLFEVTTPFSNQQPSGHVFAYQQLAAVIALVLP